MSKKNKKKLSNNAMKGFALGTALSLGTFGFTAIGTGAAFSSPTVNTAAASQNTTKVIKLANGKTRVRVDLADNLRGKTVIIRTSRIVNGERRVFTLGKIKLTKTGKGYLTVSRQIRVDDRIIVRDSGTSIVNSKVSVIDDRTPAVVAPVPTPAPPASGGESSGGSPSTVVASVTGSVVAVDGTAVSAGTAEVQKITLTGDLAINDEYTVTLADGTTVLSGAIAGDNSTELLADLVAKLELAKAAGAGFTFSVGTEVDEGKIIITYAAVGDVTGTATITQTKKAGVVVAAEVTASVTGTGATLVEGNGDRPEVQAIELLGGPPPELAIGDDYTVTLADGTTTVSSGAIAGDNSNELLADLVAKLELAKAAGAGFTFSVGTEVDEGKIIITYAVVGDVTGTATITQTKKAGVVVAAEVTASVTGTGDAADGSPAVTASITGSVFEVNGTPTSAGTAEVQKITLAGTLAINDEYTVTLAGGTAVTSGALVAATVADLVAKLEANKAEAGVTFTAGTEGDDAGKIIITYAAVGDVTGAATFVQTKKAGVAIS